ncbi:MAG: hypothetical protein L0K73_09905 [Corynebacterium variabile]|uniref:hypothetical protein n=1 Tax=Corynebacterium variabile TaxID=1727 RepID=UPI0026476027|nr:hypothetical protein [Corynebacterium variabile]MDN6537102.1 hypothetical protein [Corynebacterium variabile]
MKPTVDDLVVLADQRDTPRLRSQAVLQLATAEGMVAGYCRGRHVDAVGENRRPGVGEVVLSLACRLLANPQQVQVREQASSVSMLRGEVTVGFTLAEQFVLNRYRKRAL